MYLYIFFLSSIDDNIFESFRPEKWQVEKEQPFYYLPF